MLLYLSMVLIVPVLYGVFHKNNNRDKIILVTVCSMMLILLALRKPFSDVTAYWEIYNSLKGVSFSEIIRDFHIISTSHIVYGEWGYSFICWIFVNLGIPFQLFLFFESAFCVICIYSFICKNSVYFPLSIALIVGFGIFDYMFVIIRQTMALGFLFLSFEFIKKRNLPAFLALVLAATMMHRTSLLFLVVYPLSYLPVTRINVAIFSFLSLLIIPLYPVAERLFLRKIMQMFMKEGYMEALPFEFGELIILILIIATFLMFFYDKDKVLKERDKAAFWAFMISLPVQATACYMQILGRVSTLTFLPFASIAIPNLLETNDNKKLVKIFEIHIYLAVLAYYAFCLFYDKRFLEIIPYKTFFMN